MITKKALIILAIGFLGCSRRDEKIRPEMKPISESIYASGVVKSKNQYQAFVPVNGIVESIYVTEGDTVKAGDRILSVSNETQRLNLENARLAADFSGLAANQGKLQEASLMVELARNKMKTDSAMFFRQKSLWKQNIGSKVELEQRELAFENSKTAFQSAGIKFEDVNRQVEFASAQSNKNFMISSKLENDYTLKSEIDGIVFNIAKSKGEIVSPQTPIAVIGDAEKFILEMQVDENDILKMKKGLSVLVSLDSYKGKVFEAIVTKINPLMNERSKTFLIEAEFLIQPEQLYPNINFEANIVLSTKEKAMLIPRNYLLKDSLVVKENGDTLVVKTGLKDFKWVEIVSGLSESDELKKPQ